MRVYVVRKISDHEYGCRNIEAVFSTQELAEEYVNNSPDNWIYKFWDGISEPNLLIEDYEVIE